MATYYSKKYIFKYYNASGSLVTSTTLQYTRSSSGSKTLTFPSYPSRSGFTCSFWSKDSGSTKKYAGDTASVSCSWTSSTGGGSVIYYAYWSGEIDITFIHPKGFIITDLGSIQHASPYTKSYGFYDELSPSRTIPYFTAQGYYSSQNYRQIDEYTWSHDEVAGTFSDWSTSSGTTVYSSTSLTALFNESTTVVSTYSTYVDVCKNDGTSTIIKSFSSYLYEKYNLCYVGVSFSSYDIPYREGYTFLGLDESPDSKVPTYPYSGESSWYFSFRARTYVTFNLYCVWKKNLDLSVKVDGSWKGASDLYTKVNGSWFNFSSLKIKDNGSWK